MPRGGPRQGVAGRTYSNRTDLQRNARPLPVSAAPGQPYGARGQQEAAQRAMPLSAPQPGPMPGELGALDRPTERPQEPLTAGLPMGAGPGPEVLPFGNERDEDLSGLAPYLGALELMASQPNSTASTRAFVRRLRGAMPYRPTPEA